MPEDKNNLDYHVDPESPETGPLDDEQERREEDHIDSSDNELYEETEADLRKIKIKAYIAALALFVVVFLPRWADRYRDFDVVHNSPLFIGVLVVLGFYVTYVLLRYANYPDFSIQRHRISVKRHLSGTDLASFLASLLAFLVIMNSFAFSFASVEGASMSPTLHADDSIIINHFNITYKHGDLVVVFIDNDLYFVKRIIGLAGDEIEIDGDLLYINDVLVPEPYLENGMMTCPDGCIYTVEPGYVFVLGDNRTNSTDSRNPTIGQIPIENLYGRVVYRISPLSNFGRVK